MISLVDMFGLPRHGPWAAKQVVDGLVRRYDVQSGYNQ